ncbi:hypothetical protein HKBW3S47_00351 [Candidatus Hakubella thermalkaliphila]|uniref:Uncharacterized protein n=1 Tax=Candidatus Hakubella thermalkaliphila TaxID=2754717 RepID=A0A6V8Q2J0_9ACTN|nr:hypothetical protein HKBW3S47_00351 [Candidatus Hakubella thermalkaliphila]
MKRQQPGRCLIGVALAILGLWIVLVGQWGKGLVGYVDWMWWTSLVAGLCIIGLGIAIAIIEARHPQ